MQNMLIITDRQKPVLIGITVLIVLFGLFVRLNGLGAWPLSVDEYYLTKPVLSILRNGLPGYECGGFYTRGLLQQYVSAIAVATMGNTELAMRIYPMMASLLMLWFVFLLGKRAGGLLVGCLALMLVSLSLWEIEFARFARMYMPFQALMTIQVYLLVKVIIDGADEKFKWMLLVSLCGIVTYEGAIFLVILPIIAILRRRSLQTPRLVILAAGILLLTIGYGRIPFETLGIEQSPLPAEVIAQLASRAPRTLIKYPALEHARMLLEHPMWLAFLLGIISVAGLCTFRFKRYLPILGIVFWVIALGAMAFSLVGLGVLIYLCMTLLLLDRAERTSARNFVYFVVVPTIIIVAFFWAAFFWLNLHMGPRDIAVALIKYPNLFGFMGHSILKVIPVLMLVLFVPTAVYATVLVVTREHYNDVFVLLGGLALMFYTGVVMLSPHPFETRYSLFIYPLVVCLFCISVASLSTTLDKTGRFAVLLPIFVMGVFACTEDFDVNHYLNINTAEVNYRVNYPGKLQEHYKSRNDNRGPAYFINERLKDTDTVIIAASAPDFYLDRVDYRYKELWLKNFPNHIICGMEHDKWSNAPVLYKKEQIENLVKSSVGDVWLIEKIHNNSDWYRKMKKYEVFIAPDMRTHVLKIPPGGG